MRCNVFGAAVLAALVFGPLVACSESSVTGQQPLSIELVADRQAAETGERVAFVVEARGGNLVGVTLDYGDGVVDSFPGLGGVSLGQDTAHVFASPGNYVVVATVLDLFVSLESLSDSVTLEVSSPAP